MRLGLVGVTLFLASTIAIACGGNAIGLDEGEGDADTAPPAESDGNALGEGYVSHCDELAEAVQYYAECTEQTATADYVDSIRRFCEADTALTPTRCVSEFRALTRCQARALEACDPEARCRNEEKAYTDCVSGGTCPNLGGGSFGPYPGGLEISTNHLACQCRENEDEQRVAGAPCDTPFDCPQFCCACPANPNFEYNASVCDKSRTGGVGQGVCQNAEAACAASTFRCKGGVR